MVLLSPNRSLETSYLLFTIIWLLLPEVEVIPEFFLFIVFLTEFYNLSMRKVYSSHDIPARISSNALYFVVTIIRSG